VIKKIYNLDTNIHSNNKQIELSTFKHLGKININLKMLYNFKFSVARRQEYSFNEAKNFHQLKDLIKKIGILFVDSD